DLDGENRERTRLRLFQFSLRDQASNWLKRLPAGSITIWDDLTTHFLAQFFPPGRTAKLRIDILIFQQHHGEYLLEAWTRCNDLLQKSLIMASTFGSKKLHGFRKYCFNQPYQEGGAQKKGNQKPIKAFSLKYLSIAYIIELSKNPSALKCVHFVNSIVILSEENKAEEGETTTDITPKNGHNIAKEAKDEVKEVMEEDESEVETDWEVKEILEDEEEDGDEDTTSIIDRHLGEMAFGRPFIDETGLVYDREEGMVMFKQTDKKITFKMPHTMEIFKQTRLMGLSIDSIPLFAYEENFGHGRKHYYQSLLIGDEYMQDGGNRRGIRHLMRLEREAMGDKEEVT
ncbi:MAK10-like protein, partial [Tanacetum coccineum]